MTDKRRYTVDEIYEMKTQIFEDALAEKSKYIGIANWIEGKSKMKARATMHEYGGNPENPHIPYYFVAILVPHSNALNAWVEGSVRGPNACKPPMSGLPASTPGWMLDADIPGIGQVSAYVCLEY